MLNDYYKDVMKIISNYLTDKKIQVSNDELTDTIRHLIANVITRIY